MVQTLRIDNHDLARIAEDVSRSLSYARVSGLSAFITTAVTYANGTAVVVRVDETGDEFFVSDDGYGALTAEMMGGLRSFSKVARGVAGRFGVEFDERLFFVLKVSRDQLPAAVAAIANVSALAVERTIYAQETAKPQRSRVLFEERLQTAFHKRVHFNQKVKGALRKWDVDALVDMPGTAPVVFEFVTPSAGSVAHAHLKLGDIKSLEFAPRATVVLESYEKTESAFRAILSNASDAVIDASVDADHYFRAAA